MATTAIPSAMEMTTVLDTQIEKELARGVEQCRIDCRRAARDLSACRTELGKCHLSSTLGARIRVHVQ